MFIAPMAAPASSDRGHSLFVASPAVLSAETRYLSSDKLATPMMCKDGGGQEHMPKSKLTPEIITAAIVGFQQQRLRIDSQIAELRAMLSGASTQPSVPEVPKSKRGKLSAAARKRIAAAQKARWAKWRRLLGRRRL